MALSRQDLQRLVWVPHKGFVELDHTTVIPGLSVDYIGRLVFKHQAQGGVIQTDVTDKVSALIEQLAKELIPEQKD